MNLNTIADLDPQPRAPGTARARSRLWESILVSLWLGASAHGTDIVWTNLAGGNWAAAANWRPNQVPGTGDTVWITNAGTYAVTLNTDATVGNLRLGGTGGGVQTFNHTGGTLTLGTGGSGSSLGVYNLAGGWLTGAGTLGLGGPFNWSSGTFGNDGSSLIVWTKPGVTISGAASKYFRGGTLVNEGLGSWSGGVVFCYGAPVLSNAPNALFDLLTDGATFQLMFGGAPVLANAGTLRRTAGTGACVLGVSLNNSGTVQAQSGTLSLTGGGISSGQFCITNGVTLELGGTHVFQAGSSVSGGGAVWVSGGSTTVQGGCVIGSLTNNAGTITFASGGTPVVTNVVLNGGTFLGSDMVLVPGVFDWTRGTLGSAGSSLVVSANGGVVVSSGLSKYFYGGTLVNQGAGSWSDGLVWCYNTAVLSNAPGSSFDLRTDGAAFQAFSAGPTLANNGTLIKSAGTGACTISLPCSNSGSVQVNSGTLELVLANSSGSFTATSLNTLSVSGTATLSAGASLTGGGNFQMTGGTITNNGWFGFWGTNTFSGGTFVLEGLGLVTNNTVVISGGVVVFNGVGIVSPASLSVSSGGLQGNRTIPVIGPLTWTGGGIGSSGSSLKVVADGGIAVSGTAGKYFYDATLVNQGMGTWSGGVVFCYGTPVLSNAPNATFDLLADGAAFQTFSGAPGLANAGMWRKTTGAGVSSLGPTFVNTGTVRVDSGTLSFDGSFLQTSGQTLLNGGSVTFAQTAQLRGGQLAGSGTVTGSLSNNAVISPGASPGLVTITGNYTETTNAHLQIEMEGTAPGTSYDQLSIGGTATLAGTLDVSYRSGFTPSPGNVFTVLVATARSGTFSSVQSPNQALTPLYDARNAMVELGNAPPSAQLSVDSTWLACHTFTLQASATDLDGSVTNLTLFMDTNVVATFTNGAARVLTVSYDFPGPMVFVARATDNHGALGFANVGGTITTLPVRTLDLIGFQINRAFKLCMAGAVGTNYQVLVSTNLGQTNWTTLGTMEQTNGIWRFSDTATTNSTQRYYRARQSP